MCALMYIDQCVLRLPDSTLYHNFNSMKRSCKYQRKVARHFDPTAKSRPILPPHLQIPLYRISKLHFHVTYDLRGLGLSSDLYSKFYNIS